MKDFTPPDLDPDLTPQVQKLYALMIWGRWLFVFTSWLTLGLYSFWLLREQISLIFEYFTWSSVRYTLAYHPIANLSLAFCLGVTIAVLLWQVSHILWGLSPQEKKRLEKSVRHIQQQGNSHFLWRFLNDKMK